MVRFINALTGTEMLVADDRKEEYMAAGHRLAADPSTKRVESVKEEPKVNKSPSKKSAPTRKK